MADACPCCGNALPSDIDDAQLVVCLGCTAHLRRVGASIEVVAPPPGEAVPAAVEREDTDRAIIAHHVEASAPAAARVGSDEPAALPPPPAGAVEANAPSAPSNPADDRTPAIGVPLTVRPAAPLPPTPTASVASVASVAPSPAPAPTPTSRLPVPHRSRAGIVWAALAVVVLIAAAALLLR